mmetsp:Transcript_20740/g.33692  ORF Transcript_20740/g.33692 Transcript_20740/m.33692 type:complete len:201 (-) Transcript_20740:449-1051(-)
MPRQFRRVLPVLLRHERRRLLLRGLHHHLVPPGGTALDFAVGYGGCHEESASFFLEEGIGVLGRRDPAHLSSQCVGYSIADLSRDVGRFFGCRPRALREHDGGLPDLDLLRFGHAFLLFLAVRVYLRRSHFAGAEGQLRNLIGRAKHGFGNGVFWQCIGIDHRCRFIVEFGPCREQSLHAKDVVLGTSASGQVDDDALVG